MYAILEGEGIEIPRYAVLDRDSSDPKRKFIEKSFALLVSVSTVCCMLCQVHVWRLFGNRT